jgi:uncharacterized membrane protein required for colicin V production
MEFSWIDIILIIVLILFTVKGVIEGFVKGFLSFFLIIIAIIAAKILSDDLSGLLKQTTVFQNVVLSIEQKIASVFSGSASSDTWADAAQLHNIPQALQKFMDNFVDTANKTLGGAARAFAENAGDVIVGIVSFLLIFMAVVVIGKVVIFLLDKAADLPVVRAFNRMGGLLVGLVKGLILAVIISTALYYVNLFFQSEALATAINNSLLIKYFYLSFLF